MITLKEHNVKPYAQLCEMLAIHQKCAYIAATGTGKSYVVGKYIEDHDLVDKTLVLVPSKAIKDAWEKLLPGITVMTYQTLYKDDKNISSFVFIICDEMHHLGGAEWGRVYRKLIDGFNGKIVGLTATPIRFLDKGRNMAEEFFENNVVEGADLPTAISKHILPSFEYITALYNLPSRMPDLESNNEFTEQLFARLDFMNSTYSFQNILKKHLDEGDHKVVVFVNQIEGIEEVKELCMGVYPNAGHFVSHTKIGRTAARKELRKFEAAEGMNFIYTVDMLNEGVHADGVDCVIMFRKTESPILYLQQLGRALASEMRDTRVKIFDFVANHKNLRTVKGGSGSVINWIREGITDPQCQIVVRDYAVEELELLDRLNAILNGAWTEAEDELLRENYNGAKGIPELLMMLPHRTENAIRDRAVKLKLTVPKLQYSDEFVYDLYKLYPLEDGVELLKKKYPQYSKKEIRQKAKALKIKRQEARKPWSEQEDEILRTHPGADISELLKMLPGRTQIGIMGRKRRIGLAMPNTWTEEMDELIERNPGATAKELQERYFPEKTLPAIRNRKRKLGALVRSDVWTVEKVELLKLLYPKGGTAAVQACPVFANYTKGSIISKAEKMGLVVEGRTRWTPEEDELLERYLDMPESERPRVGIFAEQVPNRNAESVKNRLKILKRKRKEAEANGTDTENTGAAVPTDTKAEA